MEKDCFSCANSLANNATGKPCDISCRGYGGFLPIIKNKQNSTTGEAKLPHLQRVLAEKYVLAVDKNTDYGNSFDDMMDEMVKHGKDPMLCLWVRVTDKYKRFNNLLMNGNQRVKDESIIDTLRDLSNYIDMYVAWRAKNHDTTT